MRQVLEAEQTRPDEMGIALLALSYRKPLDRFDQKASKAGTATGSTKGRTYLDLFSSSLKDAVNRTPSRNKFFRVPDGLRKTSTWDIYFHATL